MVDIDQATVRNQLLRKMSADDFALLAPHFTRVAFAKRETLVEAHGALTTAWFFEDGYGSLIAVGKGGAQAEVGLTGREGFLSIATIIGAEVAPFEMIVQCGGTAHALKASALQAAVAASPTLRMLLNTYALTVIVKISQSVLAAASQSLRSRLARWLVMCDDRVDDGVVPMTHEFLSLLLSVRRPGITETVAALVELGAITTRRGAIVIVDRSRLLDLAGDGYGTAERLYAELLGAPLVVHDRERTRVSA